MTQAGGPSVKYTGGNMPTRGPTSAFVAVLLTWLTLTCGAVAARTADEFLDPEAAFKSSARVLDERTVQVSFEVAPGYYLYREQFKFAASGATLGAAIVPPGKVKFDETFQKNVETHRDTVRIIVPVSQSAPHFKLAVTYQGCADKGLCYPPSQLNADVSLAGFGGDGSVRVVPGREAGAPATSVATGRTVGINTVSPTDSAGIDAALQSGRFWTVIGVFLIAGVLLSLTPCVLPMLPILSSIIVGRGQATSRGRGFALALSYSLGMAMVYTGIGVAAGLAGEGLAAALQNVWVLTAFAAALVALSLSMFGAYELQLPSALTTPLAQASSKLPAGRVAGVFAMGGVSALIVSPCVAAPLAGALVYLSQTRDVLLGGAALFALATGMSVPLLLLGVSAGAWLPKAGRWMDDVKRFFGVLLLAVAIWTVQPVLPAWLVLLLWGGLLVGVAGLLWSRPGAAQRWRRSVAAVLALFGVLQWVGAASGGGDPLRPLSHWMQGGGSLREAGLPFVMVRNVGELDAALRAAGRPVMLDFYADWCVSCKEMERFTFSDPAVRARLAGALLLKADVTQNNADDRKLLKRFALFGPPGTIFFGAQGAEIKGARVIGYQDSARFLQTLEVAGF
jgi:thioredoxin:protein disulfide reductase